MNIWEYDHKDGWSEMVYSEPDADKTLEEYFEKYMGFDQRICFELGEKDGSFGFEVFTSKDWGTRWLFAVSFAGDEVHHIIAPSLPSMLELLNLLAPPATAATAYIKEKLEGMDV
jgi:hypothetical protein